MTQDQSPLTRSIGLNGVILLLIALAAVIAIAAAFAAGRYVLGAVAIMFMVVALVGAYLVWRSRQAP